ncbi:hypothetical protein HD806DRAFT_486450 [Xylariaceae sp. AK1471]|nr:hypothetical protein HD806DRAFT_486450 [Xylariaceae sp. AK1471]
MSDISLGPGTPTGFEPHYNPSVHHLFVRKQAQGGSASPLPVENETGCGQDRLFDADRSVSNTPEPDPGDKEFNIAPYNPIEDQELPREQPIEYRADNEKLPRLVGDFSNRKIRTEQADNDQSQLHSTNSAKAQQYGDVEHFDAEMKSGSHGSQDESRNEQFTPIPARWRVNPLKYQPPVALEDDRISLSNQLMGCTSHRLRPSPEAPSQKPTHQTSSTSPTLASPIHLKVSKDERDRSSSPPRSQAIGRSKDQRPSLHRPGSGKMLYSQVLSGLAAPSSEEQYPSSHRVALADPRKLKHKLRSSSIDARPKRRKQQRGRERNRSLQIPVRALNPRVQLFQESDEEIDIRSAWFKHSGVMRQT